MNCFEGFMYTSLLFNAVATLNGRILNSQRSMKFLVFIRKKLYAKLIFMWNLTEKTIFNKKKKRKKQSKSKKIEMTSTIPDDVKFLYLNQYVKGLTLKYLASVNSYKQQFLKKKSKKEDRKYETVVMKDKKIEISKKPRPPNIIQMTTHGVLVSLIQKAVAERSKWPSYVNSLNLKIRKSYFF